VRNLLLAGRIHKAFRPRQEQIRAHQSTPLAFFSQLCNIGPLKPTSPHITVIGAGAFGGWTALHLLERGARVTLLDAWGPGNSRASSGGETRIMRGTYGPEQPYTELAARSLKLWAKYERRWKRQFLHRSGVLWMASGRDDAFERG
jgi:glycine/D-amino acid oxidase-like deaminating enzyme